MKPAVAIYALWLGSILAIAAIALSWYRHVEEITWRELFTRVHPKPTDE